jgi:hypothetical protein
MTRSVCRGRSICAECFPAPAVGQGARSAPANATAPTWGRNTAYYRKPDTQALAGAEIRRPRTPPRIAVRMSNTHSGPVCVKLLIRQPHLQPINQEAHERPGSHARKSLPRLPLASRTDFLRTTGPIYAGRVIQRRVRSSRPELRFAR